MKWLITVAIVLVLLVSLALLSGCASDGSFTTDRAQIDKAQTLEAVCNNLATADVAFQAFVSAKPELVDQRLVQSEDAIILVFFDRGPGVERTPKGLCKPPYTGDLDATLNTAINSLVAVTSMISTWRTD